MTKFQRAFCVCLCLCFLGVLAAMPEPFSLWIDIENIYRQEALPCFLEQQAEQERNRADQEVESLIVKENGAYLAALSEEQEKSVAASRLEDRAGTAKDSPIKDQQEVTEDSLSGEKKEPTDASLSDVSASQPVSAAVQPHPIMDLSAEKLNDYDYLMENFFILDENTDTNADQLNAARFLAEDLTIQKEDDEPQILIYHSHSQETFSDSREGVQEDTIVGVGDYLTKLLTENYGYHVLHVTEAFDLVDGVVDRSKAYDYARAYIEPLLVKNPSIEVIIDLHRDGVTEEKRLVTEINGKQTAQIMFYNGLSYTVSHGNVEYLPNPYIQDNLAFSFQLEYQSALYYPTLYRGIYLAGLRYNLHLRPKSLLLEAGAQTNTIQEVKNAMEPFADLLNKVLSGQ